ncbi:MAG: hypothetical protein WC910_07700 [Bacteroidales bacterium]
MVAYTLQTAIAIFDDAVVDQQATDRICHDSSLVAVGCPDIVYYQAVYGSAAVVATIDSIAKAVL